MMCMCVRDCIRAMQERTNEKKNKKQKCVHITECVLMLCCAVCNEMCQQSNSSSEQERERIGDRDVYVYAICCVPVCLSIYL